MHKKQIGIIGLGLMGGSLGLALKESLKDFYFLGLDHNNEHCKKALEAGIIDKIVHTLDAIKICDIVFLAVGVDGIISIVQRLHPLAPSTTVIDLGSTKEKISLAIPRQIRQNFVAAHPMTGTEKSGPDAAVSTLYKDKTVVLCDIEKSGLLQQSVAKKIFKSLKMKLVYMNAKEHDRHAAYISHMPHAISYALANAVMKQEDRESIVALAGGGFKDMSRIAKSSPNMWEDIFRQNRDNLLESICSFESELKKCRNMVENEEWDALGSWMRDANMLHNII